MLYGASTSSSTCISKSESSREPYTRSNYLVESVSSPEELDMVGNASDSEYALCS